ncbi:MAG: hypothetical protein ACREEM_13405 [Blastocatellia bacterium]
MRKRPDLYASLDVAIMRRIMGEDLSVTLSPSARQEWIAHINSYQNTSYRQTDGAYADTFGHSSLHANGMVIGTLGGRQKYPVRLYDEFDTAEKVVPWLEEIDWRNQWRASHLFWGGAICFSFSRHCPPGWVERVFVWLDANLAIPRGPEKTLTTFDQRNNRTFLEDLDQKTMEEWAFFAKGYDRPITRNKVWMPAGFPNKATACKVTKDEIKAWRSRKTLELNPADLVDIQLEVDAAKHARTLPAPLAPGWVSVRMESRSDCCWRRRIRT